MKKLLSATLAVAFIFGAFGASAQTIAVSAVDAGNYVQFFDTPLGSPFGIAVWMDTGVDASTAAEFVVTELRATYPTLFSVGTTKINGTNLDLGDNALGEYLLSFGACMPAGAEVELVNIQYLDFAGLLAPNSDDVLELRGFEPGDTRPSSFNGAPGYVDCNENKIVLTIGGADGGVTGSGVLFADGSCVLNPTPLAVGAEDDSFGSLKARF